jgi:hypothetical protein
MLLLRGLRDAVNMAVKDCSTCFLVEKQPKKTYPPIPRFSARTVLLRVFGWVFPWGLVRRSAGLHVGFASEFMLARDVLSRWKPLGQKQVSVLFFLG